MKKIGLLVFVSLTLILSGCSGSNVREGVDSEKAAAANAKLGLQYMLQGNDDVAMEKLKRALKFDSTNAQAHHYIAELYHRLGRDDLADEHFHDAIYYHEGDDSTLFNNYGAFLCGQDRFDDGEEQFRKVLDNPVYPRRDQVYENMGLCQERKPDLDKAEEYLRKALKMNPRLPKSLLAMARISLEKENHLSARAYLQRFQAIARPTPESLWLGIRVERVLGDKNALASYGLMLKNEYPNAPQTKLYLDSK